MKPLLKILSFVWLAFWLYMGIIILLDTPKQVVRDKEFVETQLMPPVKFIKAFKTEKSRLPSKMEFYLWAGSHYNRKVSFSPSDSSSMGPIQYLRKIEDVVVSDQYKFRKADWSRDFGTAVWRGALWQYYFSWSDSYEASNSSWADSLIASLVVTGFGLSPILLWKFMARGSRKASV